MDWNTESVTRYSTGKNRQRKKNEKMKRNAELVGQDWEKS